MLDMLEIPPCRHGFLPEALNLRTWSFQSDRVVGRSNPSGPASLSNQKLRTISPIQPIRERSGVGREAWEGRRADWASKHSQSQRVIVPIMANHGRFLAAHLGSCGPQSSRRYGMVTPYRPAAQRAPGLGSGGSWRRNRA